MFPLPRHSLLFMMAMEVVIQSHPLMNNKNNFNCMIQIDAISATGIHINHVIINHVLFFL